MSVYVGLKSCNFLKIIVNSFTAFYCTGFPSCFLKPHHHAEKVADNIGSLTAWIKKLHFYTHNSNYVFFLVQFFTLVWTFYKCFYVFFRCRHNRTNLLDVDVDWFVKMSNLNIKIDKKYRVHFHNYLQRN